jgi:ABC-type multidrug transport system ATPase subunit
MSVETRLCTACGSANPVPARFCDQCGETLAGRPTPPTRREIGLLSIGRDEDNDVVLDYPMVSARHARIRIEGTVTTIEDLASTNGTYLGSGREGGRPAQPLDRPAPLGEEDTVWFGSLAVPASRLLGGALSLGESPHTTLQLAGGETTLLGRDPACDVVLDLPMISAKHARLRRRDGLLTLEDLSSTNGTFVNGERLVGRREVAVGDVIGLGSYTLLLKQHDRLEQRDDRGNVTVEVSGVTMEVPGRRLVEEVSLTLYPSELAGLMGPSGCGKSTLMHAMNGYWPPAHGRVSFNRQDLYANFDRFRMHVGYVPQDDIIHPSLTVRQALYYSARLRLPPDLDDDWIDQRIAQVITQLGLEGTEETRVGSPVARGISGGQRKRVNLAMELISDPLVLFLDEPTSGLSSVDALAVMQLLRRLADAGKTVLLSIHQPSREVFRLMDSVVILGKDANSARPARLVFFGPAYPDSIHFFNPGLETPEPSPDLLLHGLAGRSVDDWSARWRQSPYRDEFVTQRAGTNPAEPDSPRRVHRGLGLGQWWTLVRRCLTIKRQDLWNTGLLLAQAPIIALLIVLVFAGADAAREAHYRATAIFVMIVAALWFGASSSAREIVGEWAVYRRERMINLKIPSYVASKLTVLGGVALVQCTTMLVVIHLGCGLDGPFLAMLASLTLTALTGVALGLLISSLARTSEVAISLVPLVLLPMVILGGMLRPVGDLNALMRPAAAVTPSRWAFESLLLIESDHHGPVATPAPPRPDAPPPQGVDAPPLRDLAADFFPPGERSQLPFITFVQLAFAASLVAGVLVVMRRRDGH